MRYFIRPRWHAQSSSPGEKARAPLVSPTRVAPRHRSQRRHGRLPDPVTTPAETHLAWHVPGIVTTRRAPHTRRARPWFYRQGCGVSRRAKALWWLGGEHAMEGARRKAGTRGQESGPSAFWGSLADVRVPSHVAAPLRPDTSIKGASPITTSHPRTTLPAPCLHRIDNGT